MPYSIENPPDFLGTLPKGAQKLFIEAFNSVSGSGGKEDEARIAGWGNVKLKYKKSGKKWVAKSAAEHEQVTRTPMPKRIEKYRCPVHQPGEERREPETHHYQVPGL